MCNKKGKLNNEILDNVEIQKDIIKMKYQQESHEKKKKKKAASQKCSYNHSN